MNHFITGTDTGVGKTYCTALLTKALRNAGFDTVAVKPICCGERTDVAILRSAGGNELSLSEVNPVWLEAPAAPLVAARMENRTVEIAPLRDWFTQVRGNHKSILVEGAGGWLVPINETQSVADLAVALDLSVVVVVANRLGCLNHTLLTVESIRARGLECAGLILNTLSVDTSVAQLTNRDLLQELCKTPILFEVGPDESSLDLQVA